jgi:hypothetical protein
MLEKLLGSKLRQKIKNVAKTLGKLTTSKHHTVDTREIFQYLEVFVKERLLIKQYTNELVHHLIFIRIKVLLFFIRGFNCN